MSHMTKLDKANIVNSLAFEAAAKELGLEVERNGTIEDWAHKRVKCDVAVRVPGTYGIGIKKNGTKFDLLSDWSMMRVPEQLAKKVSLDGSGHARGNDVANRLLALTTKHTLIANYRRQGFVARVTENEKREITVSLTR